MRGIGDGELVTGLTSATPLARPRVGCSSYRRAMRRSAGPRRVVKWGSLTAFKPLGVASTKVVYESGLIRMLGVS
jgi:hypothetical protein